MTSLSESRSELDAMIADIELTLVSIIQGVALTVLIETSREAVAKLDWIMWPYVLSGLIIILVFWSRVVLHILTVIRWPLEFGHNFLYIACALVEAFSFAQLGNPARWFAFVAAFLVVGWLLFAYDLRLIRDAIARSHWRCEQSVVCARETRSVAQPRIAAACFLSRECCLRGRQFICGPSFFSHDNGHIWLIALQLIAFGGYLSYVVALLFQARAVDCTGARGMAGKKPCQ